MYIFVLLPLLVTLVGAYMLIKLRAFFIIHPIKTASCGIGALRKKGVFSSFTLALAGTLGVGNVFGVAMGIILGGAGSIFWLIISALFSCILKYSETLMTASSGGMSHRGTPSVIKNTFPMAGVFLSVLYTALCLCLAFVMGASLQARSLSGALEQTLGTSRLLIAIFLALIVALITRGGNQKIEQITKKLIPLSSIIYIFMTFFVIFANFSRIPEAAYSIFTSAFSLRSMGSGILSFGFASALKEGYARGIMSNEAGVGTSSFAHGRAEGLTPREGGILGIFEVLFDTVFICGLTGVAILVGAPDISSYDSGMSLVLSAFSSMGEYSSPLLLFCIFCFAVSSIACWYFYGDECRGLLFGNRGRLAYAVLFILFVSAGVFLPDGLSVRLTDLILLFMSAPVLLTVIKSSDRIKSLSKLEKYKNTKIRKAKEKSELSRPNILKSKKPDS